MIVDINSIQPGQSGVYHRGYLGRERARMAAHPKDGTCAYGPEQAAQCDLALHLHPIKAGFLTQRRIGPYDYEYIYTRAAR